MNISKSIKELEAYFREDGNAPETINHHIKRAALAIATVCAHPADLNGRGLGGHSPSPRPPFKNHRHHRQV